MRKRNHHRHAIWGKAEQIEALLLGTEGTGTNVLNGAHSVVWINHFLTDLEGHARTSFIDLEYV
jgi:hypothetical protein